MTMKINSAAIRYLFLIAAFFIHTAEIVVADELESPDESNSDNTEKTEDLSNMKVFYMVFLKKGESRGQSEEEAAIIQKGHRANMTRLWKEGYLVMAGPMAEEGELRGIFIFDADSKEFVDSLCRTDPAIQAGRLSYEIHPWYTEAGTCLPEIE